MNKQIAATLTAIICVRLSSDHQILTLNSNDYCSEIHLVCKGAYVYGFKYMYLKP